MPTTAANIRVMFDAEAAALGITALVSDAQVWQWFTEGMNRLDKYKPLTQDITWTLGLRSVTLSTDFVELDKLVTASGYVTQPWRVFGDSLVLDDPDGATQAGGARVYYWGEWPIMTTGVTSGLSLAEDYACVYYALHRFFNRLASNRLYYKRYATMVGSNAVQAQDLQDQANSYLADYKDAREEIKRVAPAYYYES